MWACCRSDSKAGTADSQITITGIRTHTSLVRLGIQGTVHYGRDNKESGLGEWTQTTRVVLNLGVTGLLARTDCL